MFHYYSDPIMVEEDEEAFMIRPQTKEIIAAAEFDDYDEFEMANA